MESNWILGLLCASLAIGCGSEATSVDDAAENAVHAGSSSRPQSGGSFGGGRTVGGATRAATNAVPAGNGTPSEAANAPAADVEVATTGQGNDSGGNAAAGGIGSSIAPDVARGTTRPTSRDDASAGASGESRRGAGGSSAIDANDATAGRRSGEAIGGAGPGSGQIGHGQGSGAVGNDSGIGGAVTESTTSGGRRSMGGARAGESAATGGSSQRGRPN